MRSESDFTAHDYHAPGTTVQQQTGTMGLLTRIYRSRQVRPITSVWARFTVDQKVLSKI